MIGAGLSVLGARCFGMGMLLDRVMVGGRMARGRWDDHLVGCCSSAGSCDGPGRGLAATLFVGGAFVRLSLGRVEDEKGIWWMPWRQEAMKDVARCDKSRGAASRL